MMKVNMSSKSSLTTALKAVHQSRGTPFCFRGGFTSDLCTRSLTHLRLRWRKKNMC